MDNIYLSGSVTSLNTLFSTSIHLPENVVTSFFFTVEYYSILYLDHILVICLTAERHLGWVLFLASVNRVVMNTASYSFGDSVFFKL